MNLKTLYTKYHQEGKGLETIKAIKKHFQNISSEVLDKQLKAEIESLRIGDKQAPYMDQEFSDELARLVTVTESRIPSILCLEIQKRAMEKNYETGHMGNQEKFAYYRNLWKAGEDKINQKFKENNIDWK